MTIDSLKGKLLAHAFGAAPLAFVFGLFLVRTMKDADIPETRIGLLPRRESLRQAFTAGRPSLSGKRTHRP